MNDPGLAQALNGDIIHGGNIYDDAYRDERDASLFAAKLPCPYLRIQFIKDHVQGYSKYHMMQIINAATEHSGQWTRCNDNPPNIIYKESELENYHFYEGYLFDMGGSGVVFSYIEEMFFEKPYLH